MLRIWLRSLIRSILDVYKRQKWFVEGDIKGCFDNVDHHVLIAILRKRIADEHFIGLLWKFLKAGYMAVSYTHLITFWS